jgi:hypothetical protein
LRYVKAQKVRTNPHGYFSGYRRLAETASSITEEKCWTCRHAIAFVTWHCERKGECDYKRCYVKDEITKADFEAGENYKGLGVSRWCGLPPNDHVERETKRK